LMNKWLKPKLLSETATEPIITKRRRYQIDLVALTTQIRTDLKRTATLSSVRIDMLDTITNDLGVGV
jgi:hypothetical protein